MKPTSSGYAHVNGIKLYHEIYGQSEPLMLIHGGLTTIGEMEGWVQPLAKTWQVIAVEMQGHGRTADTDRPMSFTTMGDDIAALLDHLKIPKADLVGHSERIGPLLVLSRRVRFYTLHVWAKKRIPAALIARVLSGSSANKK